MTNQAIPAPGSSPRRGRTKPPAVRMLPAARGNREYFFDDPAIDKVYTMLLAVMGEVSVLRERIDTHERLAAHGIVATPEAIDQFVPSADDEAERDYTREDYVRRVFRVLAEETARLNDPAFGQTQDWKRAIDEVRGDSAATGGSGD